AEAIPPKPPAVVKPIPDPLDAFFLPHKQNKK
ncbi:MAG: OB-fold nucleic acid binding domain protein, partial [Microcystis panniformis]